ncbi:hypothetical protein KRMM14A1259_45220 [Krasilnikovia sp. MM14-A1259]
MRPQDGRCGVDIGGRDDEDGLVATGPEDNDADRDVVQTVQVEIEVSSTSPRGQPPGGAGHGGLVQSGTGFMHSDAATGEGKVSDCDCT